MGIKFYDSNGKYWGEYDEARNLFIPFKKRTMRDCYNCKRYETEGECIECHYEPKDEPQTEDKLHDYCKKKNCVWWSRSSTMCLAERNGLACKYKSGKE